MRPVNLIPPEDRRGDSAPARKGILAYVVVAVLAVALAAVCGVVVFDKRVADREAEAAALEAQTTQAQARAASLASFTRFQAVHDARVLTIDQLARSRFDWERVLRELSLVIPEHVWLTTLNGSVSPDGTTGQAGGGSELRGQILGPALELSGCGRSHRDIARLVAAMKDIDGVTRVTATDSAKADEAVQQATSTEGEEAAPLTGDTCQTRSTIPEFNLIAAFDGVTAPAASPDASVVPPDATTTAADDGVAGEQAQDSESAGEVATAEQDAENATNLVPGA